MTDFNLPAWTEKKPRSPPQDTFSPGRTSCPWWDWWCSGLCRDSALFALAPSVLWWTSSSLPETWAHTKTHTFRGEKKKNIPQKQVKGSEVTGDWWLVKVAHLDCVRTPMTSAYRSAMMCTLPVLGPQYLRIDEAHPTMYSKIHMCVWETTCIHTSKPGRTQHLQADSSYSTKGSCC